MNDMKKRALSLLMSIALALTLLPTGLLTLPAAADEGNPVYTDGQYEADEVSMARCSLDKALWKAGPAA